jgi:hypothetical protein
LILEQLNKGSFINMINATTSGSVNLFNSSVPVTISVDATSTNTASKVVARDASGNFSAGTITASLVGTVTGNLIGNAATATTAVNATNAVNATTAVNATNAATATNPQGGGSFITSSNIASQSVAFATNSTNAVNAVTAASCSGNAVTATNPQVGGSFITSSNIASQAVAFATNANNATTAVNVSGVVALGNGGTGQTSAVAAGSALGAIGVGQTTQNVSASRVATTTYTNDTGRPIMVYISTVNSGALETTAQQVFVDGIMILYDGIQSNRRNAVTFIVPAGSTYRLLLSGGSIETWCELRA